MSDVPEAAFTIRDLEVFDEAHLREVIAGVSGAVHPDVAGRALMGCDALERAALEPLAARIERALPPDDRARFCRARRSPADPCARDVARGDVLERLFWDLTYWKTPEEFERLTLGEQVHLGALDFARVDGSVVLDAGAGTGRTTLPLAARARRVFAVDPAPPLLRLLEGKIERAGRRNVELLRGTFARVPLPDDSVDAVVSCSAFGPLEVRGGERGLDELQRVTRPGGRIVVMWPEDPAWFARHGFHHATLPGHLAITFPTLEDGLHAARRFYGSKAVRHLEATGKPELPFSVLGVREPRDLCWITVRK
jgi:SAM-dependent methyltransferase